METEVPKKLFTVDEYLRMGEAGIFDPEARLELIEGEIIEMSPVGDRHVICLNRANALFSSRLASKSRRGNIRNLSDLQARRVPFPYRFSGNRFFCRRI